MRATLLDEGATELALTSDQELAMWTGRQGGQQVVDTETQRNFKGVVWLFLK